MFLNFLIHVQKLLQNLENTVCLMHNIKKQQQMLACKHHVIRFFSTKTFQTRSHSPISSSKFARFHSTLDITTHPLVPTEEVPEKYNF